jgi:cytochrome c-type protein NapB
MKQFLLLSLSAVTLALTLPGATAQEYVATLRGDVPLGEQTTAPIMAPEVNKDLRQVRAYPEQPPIIPHKIENYQIDQNANKCLTCHSRTAVALSQAPMVSVTHFMNRDGQVLTSVSPRRYFCTQCHVSQLDVTPLVDNDFVDVDTVLEYLQQLEGETK